MLRYGIVVGCLTSSNAFLVPVPSRSVKGNTMNMATSTPSRGRVCMEAPAAEKVEDGLDENGNSWPSSYDKEGLLSIARGEVYGKDNARLPLPPMLMMDRILETSSTGGLYGKGHVVAELDIDPSLWFFPCHFEGDPIMPGCLGLDALWQLTGYNLAWRGWQGKGYALGVGKVAFSGMVRPDRKLVRYEVDFTKAVKNRRLTMGVANGKMYADGELLYETEDMKVVLASD